MLVEVDMDAAKQAFKQRDLLNCEIKCLLDHTITPHM